MTPTGRAGRASPAAPADLIWINARAVNLYSILGMFYATLTFRAPGRGTRFGRALALGEALGAALWPSGPPAQEG